MERREPLVDDVAAAILDGSTIDWPMVDTASSDADRALIGELRLLSTVANLHRLKPDLPLLDSPASNAWGHLRLLDRIGGGSFGDVYRAYDTRLEREVAVKIMPAPKSELAGIADILREGRLLARVRHPGVVTVYDAQQIGHHVGMWMEFVRGRTLEERLEQEGPCTAVEAIDIGIELCRAVSAVHEAGLLHRDIKTQNVMRADDGRLVLMDFGVGRERADPGVRNLAGTPLYLAPEILGGQPATVSTDVYAVGVLLFRMLTGSFPVQAKLVSELHRAHSTGERQPLLAARPDLPGSLAAVIDRAAAAEPGSRYASAAELAEALDAARPRVRSRRWMLVAAAAVLVIGSATLAIERGWLTIRRPGGPMMDPQQWILVSEFSGTTGDAGLDAAVRQAVTSELEASSYVNVFPAVWVRDTLQSMARPGAARVDESLGQEIARSAHLAVLVSGSLEMRDGAYRIAVRARHVATGRVLNIPAEARRSREEALYAAFALGRTLREKLGESAVSIRMTSPPLIQLTAQSFAANRHFALGRMLYEAERYPDALPHFSEAVALDPEFAMAHLYQALSYSNAGDYDQRQAPMEIAARLARSADGRLGQIEREKILADYNSFRERFAAAAAHMRTVLDLRPGDGRMLGNLGVIYGSMRQYAAAIDAFEKALQSFPHPRVRLMLADMYSAGGRPDDAISLLAPHLDGPAEWMAYARHHAIAGNLQDANAALVQAERRSNESNYESWASLSLAKADCLRAEGHYDAAEAALRQGLDRAGRGTRERLELAMTSLLLEEGRRTEAIARLRGMDVSLSRNRIVLGVLAARAGDLAAARAVLEQLDAEAAEYQAPRPAARVHQLRAEIALVRGQNETAINEAGSAVQAFTTTWTLTTLARAQRAVGRIDDAINTWTEILARPGERATDWDAPAYSQFVLARYEIARLLELAGRAGEARAAYDQFLGFWERGDEDLPVLRDALARRVRLTPARVSDTPSLPSPSGHGAQSTPPGRVPKPAA